MPSSQRYAASHIKQTAGRGHDDIHDHEPARSSLIEHYLRSGANQYAPMPGVPALRAAIAAKVAGLYGRSADADTEITVCNGATEGLFSSIQAIVRPGDDVIVFDPAYDSYEPAITLAGGRTVHIPLTNRGDGFDFHIDWQRLTDTVSDKTRLIVLNFPQNPIGSILTATDLDLLAEIVRDTEILLLSDEVYEHIVFDGARHQSMLMHDELWQRSLVISSFGKTYHATGWKVGYCIAPAPLTEEFRKVHQFNCFAVVTPIQHALADFMTTTPQHHLQLAAFYQAKRDFLCNLVTESRFEFEPAKGTFFQILDYSAIILSDPGLLCYQRRGRRLLRQATYQGNRRRLNTDIGILRRAAAWRQAALLFCERRCHAGNCGRKALSTLVAPNHCCGSAMQNEVYSGLLPASTGTP
jgi:methionine aminotransferase